jgi:hypothetical protein
MWKLLASAREGRRSVLAGRVMIEASGPPLHRQLGSARAAAARPSAQPLLMALCVLGYNLTRALNIVGMKPLLAAVRA